MATPTRRAPTGPFSWLSPTAWRSPIIPENHIREKSTANKEYQNPAHTSPGSELSSKHHDDVSAGKIERHWKSRDNRKGRHALIVTNTPYSSSSILTPESTRSPKAILRGIWRMFSKYPYWDVSYLVAIIFTLGSIIWCINGFFAWLPLQIPSSEFGTESLYGGGITAFIGATVFEIGSVLLMIEAVNEDRTDCFGWALEEELEEHGMLRVRAGGCTHHHQNRRNFVGMQAGDVQEESSKPQLSHLPPRSSARAWTWLPTFHELTTHYFHEIGFLACLAQFIGATIFWIAGFTALPGIQNKLSTAALDGAFWAPQVVGGSGFIVSGALFMLETQTAFYKPALGVLGWHIGFWNLIGAFGFTLCGALGYSSGSGEEYQSALATFWGSWAFLIGSVLQWYESLDKHPVEVKRGEAGMDANVKQV